MFTALIAWFVFHENFDRRIAPGMVAILAGGAELSWQGDVQLTGIAGSGDRGRESEGPLAIVILAGLVTSTVLSLFLLPTLALRCVRFDEAEIEA
ncbi:MAG: hypothetical protein ABIQ10_14560 [Gemmatimonadaceae bacterium]